MAWADLQRDPRLGHRAEPATPVCSIEKGITLAQTGDTVMVRGGRYLRSGPLGINKSNFALMAHPGEHVTLDFAAATAGNGINYGADNVLLQGFRDHQCPGAVELLVVQQHHDPQEPHPSLQG